MAFSFTSCGDIDEDILTTPEEGVVINGVRWATRNVAAPGTFIANPQDAGSVKSTQQCRIFFLSLHSKKQ